MMAGLELRISAANIPKSENGKVISGQTDNIPELVIAFHEGEVLLSAVYLSKSYSQGDYDKVEAPSDADGDGGYDEDDEKLYLQLGNAAAQFLR